MQFLIINGPNLNLLGKREPDIYGDMSLDEIIEFTEKQLDKNNHQLEWYQTNIEGEIIEKIHSAVGSGIDCLIINPAGYSHTSVAILDALKLLKIPVVEVHLTNTHSREDFRKKRITAQAASVVIEGLGKEVYITAINSILKRK